MAVICDDLNMLFILPPKTGSCSIVERLMKDYSGRLLPADEMANDGMVVVSMYHSKVSELLSYNLLTKERLSELQVIVTIRNPFDWLVSFYKYDAYLWGFYQERPRPVWWSQRREAMKNAHEMNFDDWIERHFSWVRSVSDDYVKGAENVRHLRFERLGEDFEQIMIDAGQEPISLSRENVTPTKTKPYQECYSERSRQMVEKWLAGDLRKYGYKF